MLYVDPTRPDLKYNEKSSKSLKSLGVRSFCKFYYITYNENARMLHLNHTQLNTVGLNRFC